MTTKHISILGSTGSIGRQTLEVMAEHADKFCVHALYAHQNADLLIEQSIAHRPQEVVIGEEALYAKVKEALTPYNMKVHSGRKAMLAMATQKEADMVVSALVGFAGLAPTLCAVKEGKQVALANKESLVIAGDLIMETARQTGAKLYPIDSEHSAIFQCLVGEQSPVDKIILTASGGPFRGKKKSELLHVKKEKALRHPNWSMGHKITIDSSTMMNKGLEVIEAKWLFDLSADQIEIVVHPQSIIHSMVQFQDGAVKAQMGLPDMRVPILYALSYPERLPLTGTQMNLLTHTPLTFEPPDIETFPSISLSYRALATGGNCSCILNAANEIAVQYFMEDRINFLDIPFVIETCMDTVAHVGKPTYEEYKHTDEETRRIAEEISNKI